MITLQELTNFDLERLDPTRLDLTRFDLRKLGMSNLPKFDLPGLDLPRFDLPVDAERLAGLARDTALVGLGAVMVTAQKADEQRHALTHDVAARARRLVDSIA
jgi:hypothetical protein